MPFDQSEFGIEITAPAQCRKQDGLRIRGAFRVEYPDVGVPETPSQIPKHIALVVVRYRSYAACKPFYDVVVFEDDVKGDGKTCVGKFSLNVFDHIPFKDTGEYVILCSLGVHLSSLVKVTVV